MRTPKWSPTKEMVSVSNVAKKSTPTLILCADCTRNIVESERVRGTSMGMKHTATLAEEGTVQLLQKAGGGGGGGPPRQKPSGQEEEGGIVVGKKNKTATPR